jgi:predicted RNase H-like HicB family nuclease
MPDRTDTVEWIDIPLSRAAAIALSHWLSTVPDSVIPVTDPSERQALADLLFALEACVTEPTGPELLAAKRALLKDSGLWVYQGATHRGTLEEARRVSEYLIVIEGSGDSYSAYSPDLPGCVASGESPEEVERLMRHAIPLHIESLRAHDEPVPGPHSAAAYVAVR